MSERETFDRWMDEVCVGRWRGFSDQFQNAMWETWQASKEKTIEECALTCERILAWHRNPDVQVVLDDCIEAIRALKASKPSST